MRNGDVKVNGRTDQKSPVRYLGILLLVLLLMQQNAHGFFSSRLKTGRRKHDRVKTSITVCTVINVGVAVKSI